MYFELKATCPHEGTTIEMTQENVETLQEFTYLIRQFILACGYNYVKEVAVEKESGDMVWSDELYE